MKPISSETSNAERWSGANYGSIGDSWPVAFTSQTTVTLTGAATGATTKNLLLQCYDNSSPGNSIQPAGWTVDASSFNIVVTFASSQTGYCVVNSSGGGGGGGVTSFSGDGTFLTNSSSTGAVTATLGTAGAHKW